MARQGRPLTKVVALLNQKGGVGKTTSTANLGAAFARLGKRVLLIDLDPQSNLSMHFGVEAEPTQPSVYDLFVGENIDAASVIVRAREGLDFMPAVTELALVEGDLAQRPDMQRTLERSVAPVAGNYDLILLDCPPSLGVLSVNALTMADEVFVPMLAHYLALRGLEKLLETVHMVSQGLNPRLRVTGILLCQHEQQSLHGRAVIDEIAGQLARYEGTGLPWDGCAILQPPVRRNIKLAEAPSFGQTIFDYAPQCPGAGDYMQIALHQFERWWPSVAEPAPAPKPRAKRTRAVPAGTQTQDAPAAGA
ncbi:MAG: ParA family protein [Planctomycetes bacterium]|nr:ParA family protein [Planctomycetota bacterium]